jgi:hypothetical protein
LRANKPWFVPQALAGPAAFLAARISIDAARQGIPRSHARVLEVGVLYTAIAGMLNLLAVIDDLSATADIRIELIGDPAEAERLVLSRDRFPFLNAIRRQPSGHQLGSSHITTQNFVDRLTLCPDARNFLWRSSAGPSPPLSVRALP